MMSEVMRNPSAINLFQMLPASIQGQDIGAQYRGPYFPMITKGGGSVNKSIMRACHDLWFSIHHDRRRVDEILGRFAQMAKYRPLGDLEANSDFVYGDWNSSCYKVARCGAEAVGHPVAEELRKFELSDALMWALSAAWRKEDGFYSVQRTGARSWIMARPRGQTSYQDENGVLYEPYSMDRNGFGPLLLGAMDQEVGLGWHTALADAVDRATSGDVEFWDHSDEEIEVLESLRKIKKAMNQDQKNALAKAVGWLDAGPIRQVPSRVIRTTGSVAWVNLLSSAPGSTSYRYGRAWFAGASPAGSWDDWPWTWNRQNLHLVADPPMRKKGTSGRAEIIERGGQLIARCQRVAPKNDSPMHSWWDINTGTYKNGWFELPLGLANSVILDVRIGKKAIKVLVGSGGTPGTPSAPGGGSARQKLQAAIRIARRADRGPGKKPDVEKMLRSREKLTQAIRIVGG